jgi:hypothetical protein
MGLFQRFMQLQYIHYYFPAEITPTPAWRTVCEVPEDVLLPLLRLSVPQVGIWTGGRWCLC